jgi:hypothetical protein
LVFRCRLCRMPCRTSRLGCGGSRVDPDPVEPVGHSTRSRTAFVWRRSARRSRLPDARKAAFLEDSSCANTVGAKSAVLIGGQPGAVAVGFGSSGKEFSGFNVPDGTRPSAPRCRRHNPCRKISTFERDSVDLVRGRHRGACVFAFSNGRSSDGESRGAEALRTATGSSDQCAFQVNPIGAQALHGNDPSGATRRSLFPGVRAPCGRGFRGAVAVGVHFRFGAGARRRPFSLGRVPSGHAVTLAPERFGSCATRGGCPSGNIVLESRKPSIRYLGPVRPRFGHGFGAETPRSGFHR